MDVITIIMVYTSDVWGYRVSTFGTDLVQPTSKNPALYVLSKKFLWMGPNPIYRFIAPMEHICHFPEQWHCASHWESYMCLWCCRFSLFSFFQLAWFSLTNLLFGMWFLSAVSLSDSFDVLWCSHFVSSRGIASSQSNSLPTWSTQ